jgi:fatty-acyl-CoA synthase
VTALSPFATPGEALRHHAARRPSATALAFPETDERLSFAEWLADAEALTRGLLDLGLSPGDHLALLAENRLEWPVGQMAAALGGFVLVPLNSHYRRDDLGYALVQSDSKAILLSRNFRSNPYLENLRSLRKGLPLLRHVALFDGEEPDCLSYGALISAGRNSKTELPEVNGGALAALLYTSGTTGFPKGALLSHRGMLGNSWGTAQRLAVGPSDKWTSIIPPFHCAGCIMIALGCLQMGACQVGVPAFDPVAMFRVIESERCTMLSGVPTSYLAMLDHPERRRFDLSSLRAGTCGGADADPELLVRCAAEFPMPQLAQVYGQTEVSTLVSVPEIGDEDRFATTGRPLPGFEIRIADPRTGVALPAGSIGQIEVKGPMVMHGYYKKPAETAETIGADGWLKTGDLGFLTKEGRVVIAGGRLRDMIIRGGENIYPAEIENLLRTHPAVGEIAVFALKDAYYGEAVGAAVKLAQPTSAAALGGFCDGRIARFKIPAAFFAVEEFPLTASGKIRKGELRRMAAEGKLTPLC